jgi:tetratricopeptide (TPR) repeat protein
VEVLERLDPEAGWMPSWTPYWRRLTEAYHMLGDHRREEAAAHRGRRQHPESIAALLYEVRAYAALGDIEAARRTADEAVALSSDPFATAGEVLFTAAQELRAHGSDAAGAAMIDRAIEWQRDQCHGNEPTFASHFLFARMLYDAGQWREAARVLAGLQRQQPDNVDIIGCLGVVAAREGDDTAARSAASALRAKTGRFHFGNHLLWSARIAAVLGEDVAALNDLRGAFARGCSYTVDLHLDIDLARLSAHERYRELLRPKG